MVEQSGSTRFYVHPSDESVALEYLRRKGYQPASIERDEERLVALVFAPLPDDQIYGLVQALPVHLSAKIGIVGRGPPFNP